MGVRGYDRAMSKTGVIVALVIAIVLTGAAMFLLKKPGPGAATGPFCCSTRPRRPR
jgi:hypothetical protein